MIDRASISSRAQLYFLMCPLDRVVLSSGVKPSGHEDNHSPSSSDKIK